MSIYRNYDRTEDDDYKLNVEKHTNKYNWAVAVKDMDNNILYWKIIPAYS